MRRLLLLVTVLAASGLGAFAPTAATPVPTRSVTVAGTEVGMYPTFDTGITRYAVTTTTNTGGSLDVTASSTDPSESVLVDGTPAAGATTSLTGLQAGQVISVAFVGGASPQTYTLMFLPAGFPELTVTGGAQASFPNLAPGLIALTLNTFSGGGQPAFDTLVDRNGVPVYAQAVPGSDLDLKQQPNGDLTVSRGPASAGRTGVAAVTLDPLGGFAETTRQEVASPLTNTDGHDSEILPDGSTILIGYEPNSSTGKLDATIQKLDSSGHETFRWSSAPYAAETTADATTQGAKGDYAHINSVVSVEHGDIIASFRHLSAAFRIATVAHDGYQPGDVIWKFGGRDTDFQFVGGPAGGPCAQHDVTELPNGHLLLFDNGSGGVDSPMCLDDGPSAPTTSRTETHAEEWALDLSVTPHVATRVWSYPSDASKYAFFAGSASRLSNGDTLIGWAADRNALATEVDAAGANLWELTTPATTPRYMTYRAALVTGPQLALTGPADGSTVARGDAVPATGGCTDWVAGVTTTCSTSGLTGGGLDTTTVGRHTWSVTAADGTGNTWTKTRSYTVRALDLQPDGLVRKAGSATWKGDGVYGAATGQTVRQKARRTHAVTAYWRVRNDGERAEGFRLAASAGNRRFRVHYAVGGTDVTAAVDAGTYRTPTLAPGQWMTIRVTVTPTRRSRVGSTRTVTMAAVALDDASSLDRVATSVTVRR